MKKSSKGETIKEPLLNKEEEKAQVKNQLNKGILKAMRDSKIKKKEEPHYEFLNDPLGCKRIPTLKEDIEEQTKNPNLTPEEIYMNLCAEFC